jgi:G3E family GTPase
VVLLPEKTSDEKAQVIIVSGFLGAGKTTLLKRILSWGKDLSSTVVIVNEFGDVGIDRSLFKRPRSGILELSGGCICCSLRPGLIETLRQIQGEYRPKRILIEATGVADPSAIAEVIVKDEFKDGMELSKMIAVLDADFWEERENLGSFYLAQVRSADLILLNKIDTADEYEIPELLREIHETIPQAQVIPTVYCNVDKDSLWTELSPAGSVSKPGSNSAPERENQNADGARDFRIHEDHAHENHETDSELRRLGYVSFAFIESLPLREGCFKKFLDELPFEVFRVKGPVRFRDRTVMLNYTGGRSEWLDWDDLEESRLVFVGIKVNPEEMIQRLEKCITRP